MKSTKIQKIKQRLLSHVDKSSPKGCWLWTASRRSGYGQFYAVIDGIVVYTAHKAAHLLWIGPVPDKMQVLHKRECSDRRCCNPAHIYSGTPQQNTGDSIAVGSFAAGVSMPGESNPRAKLTALQVRAMRALYRRGWRQAELTRHFEVYQNTVWMIIQRRQWKHIRW